MSSTHETNRMESIDLEDGGERPNQPTSNDKASICILNLLSSFVGMALVVLIGIHFLATGLLFLNDCKPGLALPLGLVALGASVLISSTYLPMYRRAKNKANAIRLQSENPTPLTLEEINKNFPCRIHKLYYYALMFAISAHSFVGFRMYKRLTSQLHYSCAPPLYYTALVLFFIYVVFIVLIIFGCALLCCGRCCCPKKINKLFGGSRIQKKRQNPNA